MTHRLLTTFPDEIVGIVQSDVIIPGKNTAQAFWFLLRKTGLGFVVRKGTEIILSRFASLFMRLRGKQSKIPDLHQIAKQGNLPLVGAKNVNALPIRQQIDAWQPDLIISVYLNQRIGKRLIQMPSQGVINVHPALLPRNRGLFPYFWALANGDNESGVTVHWVDPSFDTGAILIREAIPISAHETVLSLAEKSAELGADLLVKAVSLIAAGDPPNIAQNADLATYHSWPTAAAVRQFRRQGRRYGSFSEMWRMMTQ